MSDDALDNVRGTICHSDDDTGWMAGHLIWEHRGVHDTQAFDAINAELWVNYTFTGTRSDLCCSNLSRQESEKIGIKGSDIAYRVIVGLSIPANERLNLIVSDDVWIGVSGPENVLFVCAVWLELELANKGLTAPDAQCQSNSAHHYRHVIRMRETSVMRNTR